MDAGSDRNHRRAILRIVAAIGVASALALGVYLLLEATRPTSGLVSFSFLLVLPAAVCAFIAYVADPWAERGWPAYRAVPYWTLLAVILASVFLLHEGTICVVMLAPLWLLSGLLGAGMAWRLRRSETPRDRLNCSMLLLAPLMAMQIEPYVPLPVDEAAVVRSIEIAAPVERIWPLLRGIPDVRPGEGRWNLTQDVIGVPRPLGARLAGNGIGADRFADWGRHIRFRERITEWTPGRRIGWRFIFDDFGGWAFTDRHLMPDSPYFRITTGGYTVEPLDHGRVRVTLDTRYRIRTPVNGYSELWGQLFVGDMENNLLAIIKHRAESRPRAALS